MTKRRKLPGNIIPKLQTTTINEKKTSIEQLFSFKDLLANIENIEVNDSHLKINATVTSGFVKTSRRANPLATLLT